MRKYPPELAYYLLTLPIVWLMWCLIYYTKIEFSIRLSFVTTIGKCALFFYVLQWPVLFAFSSPFRFAYKVPYNYGGYFIFLSGIENFLKLFQK